MSTPTGSMPPTRLCHDELDLVEHISSRDSAATPRLAEERKNYVAWERQRDREEAQLRHERESRK